jgi:NADP-dependent 3-hydroxy acid dehydrogenase YdfG
VVITGATAGVGRATARLFAAGGAAIGLLARGHDGLGATAAEVVAAGGRALPLAVDVANPDQVEAAAARVEAELGPIDIWINNAMTTVFSRISDIRPEEFRRVIDVTMNGAVWGTMAALRRMTPRRRGTIVQVGSALAYRAIPLQAAYCAAKHGMRAFTDSLRSELIYDRIPIHLTMVHLPGLNTPQFTWCHSHMERQAQPVPPIFQPEIAAEAVHWAAHHRRREVYVGFPTVQTVLGSKLVPGFLDGYLARHAFEDQMTDSPAPASRPFNLFAPVPGDHGARGIFDQRARNSDWFSWLSVRAGAAGVRVAGAALALIVVAAVLLGAVAIIR